MIQPGSVAPHFSLSDQDGETVALDDFVNSKVLLAFYPLNFSPVCRDQLSIYEEELVPQLEDRGVSLVGISVDSPFSHRAFRDQLGLTVRLLSDFHPKGEVSDAYGAYIPDRGHNNRSLVLVDEEGRVEWAYATDTPLDIPAPDLPLAALG